MKFQRKKEFLRTPWVDPDPRQNEQRSEYPEHVIKTLNIPLISILTHKKITLIFVPVLYTLPLSDRFS